MIRLSLYDRSDRNCILEVRELIEGAMVIGRGQGADWVLDDPDCSLSRLHCKLELSDGRIMLYDLSSNGVFVEGRPERCERGAPMVLRAGQSILFGQYALALAEGGEVVEASRQLDPVETTDVGGQREPVALGLRQAEQGPLLEAFCHAAGLDISAIAAEDPAEVMARLGAIYREMVAGLAELMHERSLLKDQLPDHTTVTCIGNNPFRWASAARLTADLLKSDREGFMGGAEAVAASYLDLQQHSASVVAGMRAMTLSAIAALAPEMIEARLQGRSPVVPGFKAALAWREYAEAHDELRSRAEASPPLAENEAFRKGYVTHQRAGA